MSRPVSSTAIPTLTYTTAGLVNGDTLTGLLATTATTTSNVGIYGITQGTLAASSNYALTYTGNNLTVTAAALTVTANPQSRAYGAANPALTYTSTGLVNGDTLTGLLATTATTTSNVGAYGITQGTLAASSNYALTYTGNNLTDRDGGGTHGRRQRAEQNLWRRQSDADLCRDRPRQWRHADRAAGHDGDHDLQRRRLRYHPRHAGGVLELRADLYRQHSDCDGGGAHGRRQRAEQKLMGPPIRR